MNSHPEDISHRDRESAERHQRDQFPAGTPRQSNTASLQIHQPVASRLPGAIHSPGGLLATHGGSGPPIPLGAPSGAVNSFGGGPIQTESNRPLPHNAQNASNQMFGAIGGHNQGSSGPSGAVGHLFGGPLQQEGNRASQGLPFGGSGGAIPGGTHPIPSGGAGSMPQGQQPILNVSQTYSFGRIAWRRSLGAHMLWLSVSCPLFGLTLMASCRHGAYSLPTYICPHPFALFFSLDNPQVPLSILFMIKSLWSFYAMICSTSRKA